MSRYETVPSFSIHVLGSADFSAMICQRWLYRDLTESAHALTPSQSSNIFYLKLHHPTFSPPLLEQTSLVAEELWTHERLKQASNQWVSQCNLDRLVALKLPSKTPPLSPPQDSSQAEPQTDPCELGRFPFFIPADLTLQLPANQTQDMFRNYPHDTKAFTHPEFDPNSSELLDFMPLFRSIWSPQSFNYTQPMDTIAMISLDTTLIKPTTFKTSIVIQMRYPNQKYAIDFTPLAQYFDRLSTSSNIIPFFILPVDLCCTISIRDFFWAIHFVTFCFNNGIIFNTPHTTPTLFIILFNSMMLDSVLIKEGEIQTVFEHSPFDTHFFNYGNPWGEFASNNAPTGSTPKENSQNERDPALDQEIADKSSGIASKAEEAGESERPAQFSMYELNNKALATALDELFLSTITSHYSYIFTKSAKFGTIPGYSDNIPRLSSSQIGQIPFPRAFPYLDHRNSFKPYKFPSHFAPSLRFPLRTHEQVDLTRRPCRWTDQTAKHMHHWCLFDFDAPYSGEFRTTPAATSPSEQPDSPPTEGVQHKTFFDAFVHPPTHHCLTFDVPFHVLSNFSSRQLPTDLFHLKPADQDSRDDDDDGDDDDGENQAERTELSSDKLGLGWVDHFLRFEESSTLHFLALPFESNLTQAQALHLSDQNQANNVQINPTQPTPPIHSFTQSFSKQSPHFEEIEKINKYSGPTVLETYYPSSVTLNFAPHNTITNISSPLSSTSSSTTNQHNTPLTSSLYHSAQPVTSSPRLYSIQHLSHDLLDNVLRDEQKRSPLERFQTPPALFGQFASTSRRLVENLPTDNSSNTNCPNPQDNSQLPYHIRLNLTRFDYNQLEVEDHPQHSRPLCSLFQVGLARKSTLIRTSQTRQDIREMVYKTHGQAEPPYDERLPISLHQTAQDQPLQSNPSKLADISDQQTSNTCGKEKPSLFSRLTQKFSSKKSTHHEEAHFAEPTVTMMASCGEIPTCKKFDQIPTDKGKYHFQKQTHLAPVDITAIESTSFISPQSNLIPIPFSSTSALMSQSTARNSFETYYAAYHRKFFPRRGGDADQVKFDTSAAQEVRTPRPSEPPQRDFDQSLDLFDYMGRQPIPYLLLIIDDTGMKSGDRDSASGNNEQICSGYDNSVNHPSFVHKDVGLLNTVYSNHIPTKFFVERLDDYNEIHFAFLNYHQIEPTISEFMKMAICMRLDMYESLR